MISRRRQSLSPEQREALDRMRPRWLDRAMGRLLGSSEVARVTEALRLKDLEGEVEVLEVKAQRVLEVAPFGGEGPSLFFESSDDAVVVVLAGPWIDDPHLVVAEESLQKTPPRPDEWSTDFVVERSPNLGTVFRVVVHGGAVQAARAGARVPLLLESEVLAGTLDDLDAHLSGAFAVHWR